MGTTEKLAKWAVDFDYTGITPIGIDNIKFSILDTLGVALVGSVQPAGVKIRELIKEAGGNPQARLIGSGLKTSVLNASLANGTFAHVEDYDTIPHCGVVIIPPILALGEELKLSGQKIMEAYAVGFEIGSRVGSGLSLNQEQEGLHLMSLVYIMGAAAQSAKLMGLNVAQTQAALGIAGSMASGIIQNVGMYAKPLGGGNAARAGILGAYLAKRGFTGDPEILEGKRGYFYAFGKEQSDVKRVTQNLGRSVAVERPIIYKAWPSCWGNHPALTAILDLIEKYDIKPEQVDAIELTKSSKPPGTLIRAIPNTGYEGKFSLRYHMALALIDRKLDVTSFTDEKLARPIIHETMRKVSVAQDPAYIDLPLRLQAETEFIDVTLKLTDGRIVSQRAEHGKSLKGEEIRAKYRENARFAGIEGANIERAIKIIDNLDTLENVTELMDAVVNDRKS